MLTIKVNFSDGDSLVTRFNGSAEEASAYYVGQTFNTGSVSDHMVRCTDIEILD